MVYNKSNRRPGEPDIQLGCSRTAGVHQKSKPKQWVPRANKTTNLVVNSLLDNEARMRGEIDAVKEKFRADLELIKDSEQARREAEIAQKEFTKASNDLKRREMEYENANRINLSIFGVNSEYSKHNHVYLRKQLRWYRWRNQLFRSLLLTLFLSVLTYAWFYHLCRPEVRYIHECWPNGNITVEDMMKHIPGYRCTPLKGSLRFCPQMCGDLPHVYECNYDYQSLCHCSVVIYLLLSLFILPMDDFSKFGSWTLMSEGCFEDEHDLRPDNSSLADLKHSAKYIKLQYMWMDLEKRKIRTSDHWIDVELLSQICTPNVFRFELDEKIVFDKLVYAAQNVQTISMNRYVVTMNMPVVQDTCLYALDLWKAQRFERLRHHPFLQRQ
jgi:hypothetical protein